MPTITHQVLEQRQLEQIAEPQKPDRRKMIAFLLVAQVALLCTWGMACFVLGLFSNQMGIIQKAAQVWQILIS